MYVVSEAAAIGPVEKITYAHEYTHALQDQSYGAEGGHRRGEGPVGPVDRPHARWWRATPTLTHGPVGAGSNLTAAELGEIASRQVPRGRGRARDGCRRSSRSLLFPARPGSTLALGDFAQGGFAARRQALRQPARLDGADPPPGQARRGREAGRRDLPRGPREQAGRRLDGPDPGHDGRDAAGDPAARRAVPTQIEGRGRGLGRRPRGARRGPGRRRCGVVLDTAWDTEADAAEYAAALERARREARRPRVGAQRARRPAPDRVVAGDRASSDATRSGRSRTSSASRPGRAGPSSARRYIDSGAEIPSSAERVRQRGPRGQRQRQPLRGPLRLASCPPPVRPGRTRGTASRAPWRTP